MPNWNKMVGKVAERCPSWSLETCIKHGESPGIGNGNMLHLLRHGQRSLVGYSPWGRKELDKTEWLTHFHALADTGLPLSSFLQTAFYTFRFYSLAGKKDNLMISNRQVAGVGHVTAPRSPLEGEWVLASRTQGQSPSFWVPPRKMVETMAMDCCVIFTLKEKYPKKIRVFTFLSFLFLIFFLWV